MRINDTRIDSIQRSEPLKAHRRALETPQAAPPLAEALGSLSRRFQVEMQVSPSSASLSAVQIRGGQFQTGAQPRSGTAYRHAFSTISTPPAAPAANPADSYRELIASDIKTAYGREATDEDYAYWMPKLQGGCDSGFVTGGQMSGTEYWHRRMLGWQAGGSDMATSGPYAGSSDAHGPVPAATDVVAAVPPGGLSNQVPASILNVLSALIDADFQTAYGRKPTQTDYAYWLPKLLGPCDSGFVTSGQMTGTEYWHRRMLGWQAGGPDAATSGPYAGGSEARGPVPSAIEVLTQLL